MPVRAIVIHTAMDAYAVTCNDCKEWHQTFLMRRNAECAMIGHRILKHSYRDLTQENADKLRRTNARRRKVQVSNRATTTLIYGDGRANVTGT